MTNIRAEIIVGRADIDRTSRQERELQKIAAIQGQLPYSAGIHNRSYRIGLRIKRGPVSRQNLDHGVDFADSQGNVEDGPFTDLDAESIDLISTKTRLRDTN